MNRILSFLLISLLIISALGCAGLAPSQGELFFREAVKLEKSADYFKAFDLYEKAKPGLIKEGDTKKAEACRLAFTRLKKIAMTYNHSEKEAREMIKKQYPGTTDKRIDALFKDGRLPHMSIGGKVYYFDDFLNTLYHIYPDFRSREEAGALGKVSKAFDIFGKYIYAKDKMKPGRTLANSIQYLAEGHFSIPRGKLPKKGLLKVWLPLPLVTAAQPNVQIVSIYPEKYIKYPIKLDGDIGLAYMEIPLQEIKKDLTVGAKFKFTHYEERFSVNPAKIGEYDKESELYKRYTAPGKNIAITPAIRAAAVKLAGKEKNPYLIAKKFYYHTVYDLDYSYTPHAALEALNIPESVYVLEHGYGDCGAQSMYFAALCRAMGIPARASGGMQLFPNPRTGCGDHFWAQIFLPNYGWMPVDTSVGQLARYMPGISEKQKRDFIDYFFSNMDPFRYLIQVDVDIPFIPPADEPPAFAMVLQQPTAICREMDVNPGFYIMENWKIKVKQLKNK